MPFPLRDPLLLAAKALLALFIGLMSLVSLVLAVLAAGLPFFRDRLSAELLADGMPALDGASTTMLMAALLGIAALVAMLGYLLLQLWRIVRSVGEGDPFVPANADRLNRMGWTLAAFHVLGAGLAVLLTRLKTLFDEDTSLEVDLTDGGTLLLMLVVFILARVFREGARMRADLEGTV